MRSLENKLSVIDIKIQENGWKEKYNPLLHGPKELLEVIIVVLIELGHDSESRDR